MVEAQQNVQSSDSRPRLLGLEAIRFSCTPGMRVHYEYHVEEMELEVELMWRLSRQLRWQKCPNL